MNNDIPFPQQPQSPAQFPPSPPPQPPPPTGGKPPPPAMPTRGDPRLTALAIGDIADPGLARFLSDAVTRDPALRRDFEETVALANALGGAFHQEAQTLAFAAQNDMAARAAAANAAGGGAAGANANAAAPLPAGAFAPVPFPLGAPPPRGRGMSGFNTAPRYDGGKLSNVSNFIFFAGMGLAASLMFILWATHPTNRPPDGKEVAKADAKKPKEDPGGVRLQPPAQETSARTDSTARRPAAPAGALAANNKTDAPQTGGGELALWAAAQPARTRGDENPFVETARTGSAARVRANGEARRLAGAPLGMSGAGHDYVRRLRGSLAKGRMPERRDVRIDSLVNAFLAGSLPPPAVANAAAGPRLFAETVPAPWAPGHWLLRVTVYAGAEGDMPIATDAAGALEFDTTQVAAWRMLGCEDGGEKAPAVGEAIVLRAGESFTSLFELRPVIGADPAKSPGTVRVDFLDRAGNRRLETLTAGGLAAGGIEAATAETRLAVAAATLGLAMRNSAYRGNATPALASSLASTIVHPNHALFTGLLADAAAIPQ
ncbi:MAG: hypothetical protein LBT53_01290 [Puniceicoccales bacterium]|jgi:hypothetical protein|nr:hypothetical protein [Puniceicoccales bacterium]